MPSAQIIPDAQLDSTADSVPALNESDLHVDGRAVDELLLAGTFRVWSRRAGCEKSDRHTSG